jgi:hypothetical protein
LPFGISIGARPAIDERGILDFEEQKSIRLSNKRSAAHMDQKKREADRFVFLLPQNAPMIGAVREVSS